MLPEHIASAQERVTELLLQLGSRRVDCGSEADASRIVREIDTTTLRYGTEFYEYFRIRIAAMWQSEQLLVASSHARARAGDSDGAALCMRLALEMRLTMNQVSYRFRWLRRSLGHPVIPTPTIPRQSAWATSVPAL